MISHSLEETKKIASEFASTLVGGDVVFLEGDLGAGKTSFVQGVLESFGYTEPVRSPTFSIMNVYAIEKRGLGTPPITRVIHLDFYRFNSPTEIRALGLEEFIEDPKTVLFIEWPAKGIDESSMIHPMNVIRFISRNETEREIVINKK